MSKEQERIHGLDFLRGLASLAVCWFHLTRYTYATPDGWFYASLRQTGNYGWLGVEVFFVISGFVIPYSLQRAGYELSSYPAFIAKRLVRLDPPYLASIAIILAFAFAHAFLRGHAPEMEGKPVDAARVLLHLGYVNMFFNYDWLSPSFWTLAIEFQYYLLMGLAFPLLASGRGFVRRLAFACFCAASLFADRKLSGSAPYSDFIVRFIPLFLLGVATFQRRASIVGRTEYLLFLVLASCGCVVMVGWPSTLTALLSVVVITFYNRRSVVSDFFGSISYSLYLLHWSVGHEMLSGLGLKVLNAQGDAARTLVILVSLCTCIAAACLLRVTVERPAQRWSSRFRYGRCAAAVATSNIAEADVQETANVA